MLMPRVLLITPLTLAVLGGTTPAHAQSEAALRTFFEGKRITLRIDMPGTSEGVDVRPELASPLDFKKYGDSLKRHGIAIRAGESSIVTMVRVKKDLIEFQIGGGGYGTFGDDTSTSVDMPSIPKSNREKDLEEAVRRETDATRKRALQRELDDLRTARERENRRIAAERERLEADKRERLADARLKGGSRFNLRYSGNVPTGLTADHIMASLEDYVDFSTMQAPVRPVGPPARPVGPPPAAGTPRKGMLRADAERAFGRPVEVSERREGTLRVLTLVFQQGEQRITAEFVEDVLIRYTISSGTSASILF